MANLRYRPQLPGVVADELDSFGPALIRDILGTVQSTDLQDATGWVDADFAAGLFTGAAGMTWMVTRASVNLFKYRIFGNTMVVKLALSATAVGGVVSPSLQVTIPAGKKASGPDSTGFGAYNDNGAGWVSGARISVMDTNLYGAAAASTQLLIQKANLTSNWTASVGSTEVAFQFEFQIQ